MLVAMDRRFTGNDAEHMETIELHKRICDKLEPAVYNAVRGLVKDGVINAKVRWDGNIIKVK